MKSSMSPYPFCKTAVSGSATAMGFLTRRAEGKLYQPTAGTGKSSGSLAPKVTGSKNTDDGTQTGGMLAQAHAISRLAWRMLNAVARKVSSTWAEKAINGVAFPIGGGVNRCAEPLAASTGHSKRYAAPEGLE